ncbi:MAG: hypothetical protein CVU00_10490 [Bacteroidetes bacterium HGW-Bacteroidetes-17]|nr:MAG: hypothetical protein CVU00_10490 [Bacteroidetes bacterium HGW-Bacteroidetes-17]
MFQKIINTLGTRVFSAVLNLLIAIFISQHLGAIGKGQQGLIIATITYILIFSNLVGGSTLVYLVPRYGYSRLLLPSYIWSILMSLAFYFILTTTRIIEDPLILNICILSIFISFISIHSNLLIGLERVKTANLIWFLQPLMIIGFLLTYFLWGISISIDTYFNALYFSLSILLIISFILLIKAKRTPVIFKLQSNFNILSEMFRLGFLNQLAHIFQMLSFRMSYYWLGQVYSEAEVGIYSNGTSLIESVWLLSRSISMVQYSRIVNMNDKKEAQKLTLILSKLSFVISFVILLPMIFLPSSFYKFIFGEGFGDVRLVIQSLAPGVLFLNLNIIISHYFSGTGKYHLNSMASFVGLCTAIPLFSWMIPAFGILGAGFASSISYIVTTMVILYFYKKEAGINFRDLRLTHYDLLQVKKLYNNTFLTKKQEDDHH